MESSLLTYNSVNYYGKRSDIFQLLLRKHQNKKQTI